MRLATLILGIALGLLLWALTLIAQIADRDELVADGADGWGVGMFWLLPLCWLIGIAFVTHWPLVATTAFFAAMFLSITAALQVDTATTFGGVMVLWALVSLALAVFSFLGWVGKRRERRHPSQP